MTFLPTDRRRGSHPGRQRLLVVGGDGGVFSYGDAGFHGSTGGLNSQQADRGGGARPGQEGLLAVACGRWGLQLRDARF